jgi:LuxR family maltose regulon positive regulatory protein
VVNRLRAASEARVVHITAPAGYGKTTLLAQWAARDPRPFAWVSLDRRDNDPAALLTYLASAIDAIQQVDPMVFRAAASASDSLWSTGIPRIGAALASASRPIVLVLDDFHVLDHRDCLDAIEPLVSSLTEGSQLVISARADGEPPLARLRAAGLLHELGARDLGLSDSDAKSLLDRAGVTVTDDEAAALNERAEGWPAGLYLAALFLKDAEVSPAEAISSFSGQDQFVVDYFRSELLSRLKPSEVEFLTRASVLDRMSGPVCDEVTGRSDSAKRLEAFAHANLFLLPLDHDRRWYRFHHLFQDMLRSELERIDPTAVPELHRRAAAWHERHGHAEHAIDHAFAARDMDGVAQLVGRHALPFYRSGRVVTVERWLQWFDEPDVLGRQPALAGFGAWVNALRGRTEEAERYAYALEHSVQDVRMPDGTASARPWADLVRALLCRHGISQMGADASKALDGLAPASYWRPPALVLAAVANLLEGEVEEAEQLFGRGAEESAGAGAVYAGVVAHSELALLALDRGDRRQADIELARADEFLENQPIEEYLPAVIKLAASARLALEYGQAATARELLLTSARMRPHLSRAIPWFAVQTRLELARVHLALADVDGAKTLLREADDVIRHRPDLGTLVPEASDLRHGLANASGLGNGWASTLTAAELRLLPLLTTHLSFREIAERLFVSRNTVKSQAISVYRKLDASSRSEAIERAVALGLVDAPASAPPGFTPTG